MVWDKSTHKTNTSTSKIIYNIIFVIVVHSIIFIGKNRK